MNKDNLNKTLYETEIAFLKLLLPIMGISYMLNCLGYYWSSWIQIATHFLGLVVAPMVFMLISSYVFKFCSYHRLFIYYIIIDELLRLIDWYFGIPISNKAIADVHLALAFIFIALALGLFIHKRRKDKLKICKDVKNNKKPISQHN